MDNQPLLPPQPPVTELPTTATDNAIVLAPETKSPRKSWFWPLLLFVIFILIVAPIVVIKLLRPASSTNQLVPKISPSPTAARPILSPTPTLTSTRIEDVEEDLQALPTLAPADTTDLNVDLQGL